jgi:hypothetical protein
MTVSISDIVISADIHNGDLPNQTTRLVSSGPRFYSESLANLQTFVDYAETTNVDAIIHMGDAVDNPNVKSRMTLCDEVQAILHGTSIPAYNVMGNWDNNNPSTDPLEFDNSTEYFTHIKNGPATYGPDAVEYADSEANEIRRYYTFAFGSALGIVLDDTGASPQLFPDDEYYVGDFQMPGPKLSKFVRETQLAWLQTVLAANTEIPIVIFAHRWLGGLSTDSNEFNFGFHIQNHLEVENVLTTHQASHGNIAGVFGGHHHPGGQNWWDDTETVGSSIVGAVYHDAYRPLMETGHADGNSYIQDGIKYFRLAAPIRGWGSDSGGVDETASNVFYHIKVGRFVTDGDIDIRVTAIGNNPTPDSQSSKGYFIG